MKQSFNFAARFETIILRKMKLTKKVLNILEGSATIQGRIADASEKSFATVKRWIENNDEMLTTASNLQIIREETKLSDEEILVEEPVHK